MIFNGSNANENMTLSANGPRARFFRDIGAITMDMHSVEQMNLAALGGADAVTINDMTGTGFRLANIDLGAAGAGDGQVDTVTVNGTDTGGFRRCWGQRGQRRRQRLEGRDGDHRRRHHRPAPSERPGRQRHR